MSKGVLCSPRTDAQTDTKVNTEGTLSGFQDFFLQSTIKDRPNTCSVPGEGVWDHDVYELN